MNSHLAIWLLSANLGTLTDGAIVFGDRYDEPAIEPFAAKGKQVEWPDFKRQVREQCPESRGEPVAVGYGSNGEVAIEFPNGNSYRSNVPEVVELKELIKAACGFDL